MSVCEILASAIANKRKVELLAAHGYTATGRSCQYPGQILATCRYMRVGFSHRYIDTTVLTRAEYLQTVYEWFLTQVAKHHTDNNYTMFAREYDGKYQRVQPAE